MNTIIKKYNSFIKKYKKIEADSTENEIHDKRVILRRIFPILAAYKMNPGKVKNGEVAFKLFGKLRDIQVQILKLESIELTQDSIGYLAFLKGLELKLKEKVSKFCKKKKLVFPSIKNTKTDKSKIHKKAEKSLDKLSKRVESRSVDNVDNIHKIRIEFKKFRYLVEILSYIDTIDETLFEKIKTYQDKLGEIQDYEVLIDGITKFYKKRKSKDTGDIKLFENNQKQEIADFNNEIEIFIAVCRDVISLKNTAVDVADKKMFEEPEPDNSAEDSTNVTNEEAVSTVDKVSSKKKKPTKEVIAAVNDIISSMNKKESFLPEPDNLKGEIVVATNEVAGTIADKVPSKRKPGKSTKVVVNVNDEVFSLSDELEIKNEEAIQLSVDKADSAKKKQKKKAAQPASEK
ncbi:MAG TPA: CHAD domain-containing protein [Paludibacter sp.]